MKLEQGRISGAQLTTLTIGFAFGSALIVTRAQLAKQDAWLAILLAIIEAVLFASIFLTLARRFKGQTLVEIGTSVYGKFLGMVVAALYIWYFLFIGSLVLWDYTRLINLVMPETPRWVLGAALVCVCASAVRNGIEVISRCSQILVPPVVVTIIGVTLLLVKEFQLENLLPMLETEPLHLFLAAHDTTVFPLAETVVLLMVIPFLNDQNEGRRAVLKGIVFVGLFLALIAARNTAVLGPEAGMYFFPSFIAARRINYGETFARLELLVVFEFLMTGFIKLAVLYYCACLGLAQILRLRSYLPLVWPMGAIMVALFMNNFNSFAEYAEFATKTSLLWHPIYQLGIPLLTLIVALIRKLPKESK
ncbi:MAG: endospore germination permease [Firmicutes bacterium]|nr:endospore germination permease [Bacillota bacterium]